MDAQCDCCDCTVQPQPVERTHTPDNVNCLVRSREATMMVEVKNRPSVDVGLVDLSLNYE
jgi:hypothetical protein